MSDAYEELKKLFEGARVLEVQKSDRKESICKFFVEKNKRKYSFVLFCTNLGYWTEERKDNIGRFMDFQELLEAIFEHHLSHDDFKSDIFKSLDDPVRRTVGFQCRKCQKEFGVGVSTIWKSEYLELLNSVRKRDLFAKILSDGYIDNKERAAEMIKSRKRKKQILKPISKNKMK